MTIFEGNRDLLHRYRTGDKSALTEVYRLYVDDVANLARQGFMQDAGGRVPGAGDPEAERDIVQEVFVRAFSETARNGFDGLRLFRPYLLRIAKNLMIDRLRKSGREELTDEVHESDALPPDSDLVLDAEAALDWTNLMRATQSYVATLSEELREFVRLRYEEGKSQYELMAELGVSRWRIRAWESKVERGLKKHLKRESLVEG